MRSRRATQGADGISVTLPAAAGLALAVVLATAPSCTTPRAVTAPPVVPAEPSWLPSSTSFPTAWFASLPRREDLPPAAALPRPHRLWKKAGNQSLPELKGAVFYRGEATYRITSAGLERRASNAASANELYAFPPGFATTPSALTPNAISDGARAIMVPLQMDVILSLSTSAEAQILDAPLEMSRMVGLRGDTLFLANREETVIGAYDLANLDPPMASLTADAALAVLQAEHAGDDMLACEHFSQVDVLHDALIEIAQRPSDPLRKCALQSLPAIARKGDGAVLRQLARRPVQEFQPVLNALAKDDDPETTALLLDFVARDIELAAKDLANRGPNAPWWAKKWPDDSLLAARDQVWRTGRSSSVGWCPASPVTRRAKDLQSHGRRGYGTGHPLLFLDLSRTGSWCLICQARSDTNGDGKIQQLFGEHGEVILDEGRLYLVGESGAGWAIDEFIGADDTGRYVAVRTGACLEIVDLHARPAPTITTLPDVDLRDDQRYERRRGVSFDPAGQRMLYLRGGPTNTLVIRELATGREDLRDVGPGLVWRADFDALGRWVEMTIVPSGERPTIGEYDRRPCEGNTRRNWYRYLDRDRPADSRRRFMSVEGSRAYDGGDDLVAAFGNDVLKRTRDGALMIARSDGKQRLLVPAECGAHLWHVDPGRQSVVVTCGDELGSGGLWLFRPDGGYDLGAPMNVRNHGRLTQPARRFVAIGNVNVDMDSARRVAAWPFVDGDVHRIPVRDDNGRWTYAERSDGKVLRASEAILVTCVEARCTGHRAIEGAFALDNPACRPPLLPIRHRVSAGAPLRFVFPEAMTIDSNVLAVSAGLKAALGHYRLVAEIGRGGMANVFLALFPKGDGTSRQVVLKQLRPELAVDDDLRAMFENEAQLATRFQHKNVVETYDIYSDRDLCVLVMEFLDGQTLSRIRQRAKKGSCVPFAVHLRVLAEALAGLHYVHELADEAGKPLGIVHRDVTPSNIFVNYDGRVKVVDFGIAKATIRETETRIGVVKGKLGYMSPEAVRNEYLDRRSDIFSAGVMLWEAATGRRLWQEHDELAVFRRLTAGDLPIQMPGVHGTGAEMLRIAQRALAVDPARRYATADEMRQELEDIMEQLGKTTRVASLAAYMEAFFSVERDKFQKVVDAASARFPARPVSQTQLLRNEVSASYPGVDASEAPTRISSPPTSGGTFRTATYDVPAAEASETPNFRPGMRRGFGVAIVAAAAALGVAYAANAPIDAPARAAGRPETEPLVTAAAPELPVPAPVTPELPVPAPVTLAQARGTISAVFVVHPLHARLFLDGALLEGNPAGIRRQPDDKPHLLRAEAPGYATLVRIVDLDRDIAKEFDLAPGAAPSTEPRDEPAKPRPTQRPQGRTDPWGI